MSRGFFTAILLVILAYGLGFVLFVASLPRVPQGPLAADGVVALTGGGERLDAAATLFEAGVGKRLLISGVDLATSKAMVKRLSHGGARFDCCADLGYAAQDTRGNAQETAGWVKDHGYKSLVIVTASYHMPRALREFQAAMPGVRLLPYPVEPDGVELKDWWRHPRLVRLLHAEYAKYLASFAVTSVAGRSEGDARPS